MITFKLLKRLIKTYSQIFAFAYDLATLAAGLEPTLFHRHLLNGIGGCLRVEDPRFVRFSIFAALRDFQEIKVSPSLLHMNYSPAGIRTHDLRVLLE